MSKSSNERGVVTEHLRRVPRLNLQREAFAMLVPAAELPKLSLDMPLSKQKHRQTKAQSISLGMVPRFAMLPYNVEDRHCMGSSLAF